MKPFNATLLTLRAAIRAIKPKLFLAVSDWADENRVLSAEGSSEAGQWRTDRNPPMREIMDALSEHSPVNKVALMKPSQWGGPLEIHTPIPTPEGWQTIGNLRVGDFVFGEDGKPVKVISKSEVFYNRDCYRITFSDGCTIDCDAAHLWTVDDARPGHKGKKRGEILTSKVKQTIELYETYRVKDINRYAIPLAKPLQYKTENYVIDPYLLGYWLANGNLKANQLTCHDDDADEIVEHITNAGHWALSRKVDWNKGAATNIIFNLAENTKGFLVEIDRLGISDKKRIPREYLRGDINQRTELLQGLMDGDGYIGESRNCEYSSVSFDLINDVYELCVSLGLKPTIKPVKRNKYNSKELMDGNHYKLKFIVYQDQPVFKLKRKLSRQFINKKTRETETKRRRIVAINKIDSVPVCCIGVDSESHLYLCGKGMIPTHNTEIGSNFVGYVMTHAKGPMAVVMPTERSLNDWVSQKFDPMSVDTPSVADVLAKKTNRSADNNAQRKRFAGGILFFKTAGSVAELKSTSLRYGVGDEIDEWLDSKTQGDPVELLDVRFTAFHDSKLLLVSSPTVKDASKIEAEYEGGDQRQYHVACPHCGELQTLKWPNLRWELDVKTKHVSRVFYACEHNGCVIEEHSKTDMLAQGRWIADKPYHLYRSYRINALYTPIGLGKSWTELVYLWLAAQNDVKKLVVFINTRLAETFADRSSDIKPNVLKERAEPYALRTIPIGCLFITAGVDVQDDRLEIHVLGHGKNEETWPIDYNVLHGNPAGSELWVALADYLIGCEFTNHFGVKLKLEATAIDTGGHFTHKAYQFIDYAKSRGIRRPMACKGASTYGRAILGRPSLQDINANGRVIKKGVALYLIGADTAKHLLFGRLHLDADQDTASRKVHFSADLDDSYFDGLVSEAYDARKNRWVLKKGKRNEVLDTWVLALAATMHPEIRAHKYRKSDWARLSAMVEPGRVEDADTETESNTQAAPPPQAASPRSNANRPKPKQNPFARKV